MHNVLASCQSPWQTFAPRITPAHKHWLTDTDSLTLKLRRHSTTFQVHRINQTRSRLHLSETGILHLERNSPIIERNVLLLCDNRPVVFGHTVTPQRNLTRDWPFFNALGQKALGLALFFNPQIIRLGFEYTRLSHNDYLYQRAAHALTTTTLAEELPRHLWARRCVFTHTRYPSSRMLVTEVMLPAVYDLQPTQR